IVLSFERFCLNVEFKRLDVLLFPGRKPSLLGKLDIAKPVKKFERDPPPPQYFVKWRKNHVAHTGFHLPKRRAAIVEEKSQRSAQSDACGDSRPVEVASFVSHGHVVKN